MSGYYQAVGQAGISTFLGTLKFLICACPLALLLAYTTGIKGIWFAQPIADIISFAVALFLLVKELRKLRKKN